MKDTPAVLIGLVLLAGIAAPFATAADEDTDEIPVVGRPSDLPFSGASGRFTFTAAADPTSLPVESPLTLTLTVRATGPVRHAPERIDLRQLPEVDEAFYIADPAKGVRHPDERTWEYLYQLRPRRTDVRQIPSLPFVFYNPDIPAASKRFQVIFSDPIALRVLPAKVVEVPLAAPDWAFSVADGPALTSRQAAWPLPGRTVWLLVLLLPPLGCGLWYRTWQRLNPSAARLAQQQRSRAARLALQQLERLERLPVEQGAARAAAAVAGYLQHRLDFVTAEPTPRETAALLQKRGCPAGLVQQAAHFIAACDRVRFFPAPAANAAGLPQSARQLVLDLEAETCPAGSS
jgi:hypothetical protein